MIVDALAALVALPMLKIEKDNVFGGPNGKRPLQLKLIGGWHSGLTSIRRQVLGTETISFRVEAATRVEVDAF